MLVDAAGLCIPNCIDVSDVITCDGDVEGKHVSKLKSFNIQLSRIPDARCY